MPQLERCSRGIAKFLSAEAKNFPVFFYVTSMLGSFVLEIRKLFAISEAEFSSPLGLGMSSNLIRAEFCWHIPKLLYGLLLSDFIRD